MSGVNKFDEYVGAYHALQEMKNITRLLLDFVDMAVANSCLMLKLWLSESLGEIMRSRSAQRCGLCVNLIRQLARIDENAPPPERQYHWPTAPANQAPAADLHLPGHQKQKQNCKYCWTQTTTS